MFWISIIAALGLALLLVEKQDDWPISLFSPKLRGGLGKIHNKLPDMLDCTVCTAFWAALISDAFLFMASGASYFLWPLTGFSTAGLAWILYQLLKALEGETEDEIEEETAE